MRRPKGEQPFFAPLSLGDDLPLSAIINSAADGIIIADERGRIALFNIAAENMFGCDSAKALGQPLDRFIPSAPPVCTDAEEGTAKTHGPAVMRGLRSDGEEIPLEVSVSKTETADQKLFTYIFREISERNRTESALLKLEQQLEEAQQIAHIGSWEWDVSTDVVFWTDELYRLYDLEPQSVPVSYATFAARLHPDDLEKVNRIVAQAVQARKSFDYDYRIFAIDGTVRWLHGRGDVVTDEAGQSFRMRGTAQDITERKQIEDALQNSQSRLQAALEGGGIGTWVVDLETDIAEWDSTLVKLLGRTQDELVDGQSLSFFSFIHPEDREHIGAAYERTVVEGYDYNEDFRYLHPDGHVMWISARGHVERNAEGKPVRLIAICVDISARKKAEEALRLSEEKFAKAFRASPVSLTIVRLSDGVLIDVNEGFERLFGHNASEAIGHTVIELGIRTDPELRQRQIEEFLLTGHIDRQEVVSKTKNGETRIVLFSAQGINVGGEECMLTSSLDITERKYAEQLLATQYAVSRVLAESDSLSEATRQIIRTLCEAEGWEFGASWEIDRKANLLRCVEIWHAPGIIAKELEDKTREIRFAHGAGLPGRVWSSGKPVIVPAIIHDRDYRRTEEATREGLTSAFGFPIVLGNEVTGVLDFLTSEFRQPDQKLLDMLRTIGSQIGQFIERKRAQAQAQRFVSLSPSVIYALKVDKDGFHHNWTSDNIFDLTGFTADEASDVTWWLDYIHPEDRERVLAAHAPPYEIEHQILEYRFQCKDGNYFWVRDEKRLLGDSQDGSREIVGSWSDITERVKLENQLRQAQKMEAIGQLAGGVAHDFNNLLTAIIGFSDMLMMTVPGGDFNREYIAEIRQAADQAASLTHQLLAFSRKQLLEPKVLNINETVGNTEKMLRRLIGEDILLNTVFSPLVSSIKVDPGQIEQVVINLGVNARDAMPRGGRLTIETHDIYLDEDYCRLHPYSKPGRYTLLAMTDTGGGMTPEVKARIFEPFFTTKDIGKGTGLGLATVFGIVKQSDGHIEVYSEINVGTCFKIYLPAVEAKSESLPDSETRLQGTETILLVEDEKMVREIASLILGTHGYKVLEAGDGCEAIEVAENTHGTIHLLITDVVMPEMGGQMLAKSLLASRPDLKVLFMSGYIDDAVVRHGIVDAAEAFLNKPFSPKSLARKVRDVLDEKE